MVKTFWVLRFRRFGIKAVKIPALKNPSVLEGWLSIWQGIGKMIIDL
jgi:hypothetical protein